MIYHQYICPVPGVEKPLRNINDAVLLDIPERYSKDKNNLHHWTTNWCWTKIIPLLAKEYNFLFDEKDYILISSINELGDFSYHIHKNDYDFRFTEPEINFVKEGKADILRMNKEVFLDEKLNTNYHKLFRGSHKISVVENLSIKTNRILLINGDSMTIPLIPVLANYFDKIICLDSRANNEKIENLVFWDEITDYLCMFTSDDWDKNLPSYYLTPYL